jgi:hypothetical protein
LQLRLYEREEFMTFHTVLYISNELAGVDDLSTSLTRSGCHFIALRDLGEALATAFLNRRLDVILLDQRNDTSVSSKLARLFKIVRPEAKLVLLYTQLPPVPPEHIDVCLCATNDRGAIADAISSILDPKQLAA